MPDARSRRDLTVRTGELELAGSVWLPAGAPVATVLMHPGSGPSDRDNDVFFPPIREHLLANNVAVSSFDKRGVGESTGSWLDAGIEEQAGDALACLAAQRADESLDGPVGLYGHSQGGWVVLDAAARCPDAAFVITSSGPGVSPERQERYATRLHMARSGIGESEIDEVSRYYDRVVSLLRSGSSLADARAHVEADGFPQAFETLSLPVLPDSEAEWRLLAMLIDYEPRPALERIEVPMLALFGADDPITPVVESVAAFREAVRPELLEIEVFDGADHRVLVGEPPKLADGYLDTLASFVHRAAARSAVASRS
ncbi:MAG TPA: alpha/beta hydrolase [Gaiellaceae bacterium]|nr:alpha/beta hydrolase [Gaiellaceae bacterium]